jgi:hypothetical protein
MLRRRACAAIALIRRTVARGSLALAQFPTPGAPQTEHQGGNRREGMAVDLSQIDGTARPAAWTEHVEPWRSRDQRGPDRGATTHVAAGGQLLITAINDALRLGARRGIGNLPLGLALMEMARPRVRAPMAAISAESSRQSSQSRRLASPLAGPKHRRRTEIFRLKERTACARF